MDHTLWHCAYTRRAIHMGIWKYLILSNAHLIMNTWTTIVRNQSKFIILSSGKSYSFGDGLNDLVRADCLALSSLYLFLMEGLPISTIKFTLHRQHHALSLQNSLLSQLTSCREQSLPHNFRDLSYSVQRSGMLLLQEAIFFPYKKARNEIRVGVRYYLGKLHRGNGHSIFRPLTGLQCFNSRFGGRLTLPTVCLCSLLHCDQYYVSDSWFVQIRCLKCFVHRMVAGQPAKKNQDCARKILMCIAEFSARKSFSLGWDLVANLVHHNMQALLSTFSSQADVYLKLLPQGYAF